MRSEMLVPGFFAVLLVLFGVGVASLSDDGQTLLAIKMGVVAIVGTPGYDVLSSWNAESDPCRWLKVEWDSPPSCQVVTALHLTNLGLNGTLPDSLGMLRGLTTLDLSNNDFYGEIAAGISNATGLTSLDLSNNKLTGSIPAELGKLQNLHVLRLGGNTLDAVPDLRNLTNLKELDLSVNALTGPIPLWIGDLKHVEILRLNSNGLNGYIPDNLGNSTSLAVVDLSFNQLSGNISGGICKGGNLTWIDLSNNSLVGGIPDETSMCKKLQRLRLGNNFLAGDFPASLSNLPMLAFLELGGNKFQGEIPVVLGGISKLQSLNLEGNLFTGAIPEKLGALVNLQALNLGNNKLTGGIPAALFDNGQLLTLQLSHNELSGPIPSNVNNLTNLEQLVLNDNQLSGAIPSTIGGLTKVLRVDLSNNAFTGSIPPEFGDLNKQYTLNLSGNYLTGSIPRTLGKLTKLNNLDLSNNQLSGPVPPELTEMLVLIKLDLSNNRLTGALPLFRIPDLDKSNFGGNPGLCNPGSLDVDLPQCDDFDSTSDGGGGNSAKRIGRDFGFAVTGVLFSIGSTLACVWLYRRMNPLSGWRSAVVDPAAFPAVGSFFTNVYDRDRVNFDEMLQKSVADENVLGVNRFTTLYRAANKEGLYSDLNVKLLRVDSPIVEHYRRKRPELEKVLQTEYLEHRNIMKPLGYILHDESLYVLHGHVPNGVLRQRLSSKYEKMNWGVRYNIALGVARGISHLHDDGQTPVIHLDITSENIFLSASFEPVLGDAELVEVIESSRPQKNITTVAGSIGYIAPGVNISDRWPLPHVMSLQVRWCAIGYLMV